MEGISKAFPGVQALDDVSFDCAAGEVHAHLRRERRRQIDADQDPRRRLSTRRRPHAHRRREVVFAHPVAARRAGVGIVHQELSLLPDRSVAENIFLGASRRAMAAWTARRCARARARLLARLRSTVDPDARAGDLSIAEQQMAEIAKALAIEPRILVMDEPTAALDDSEASRLLDLVRRLRDEGVAIIYVSHRMPEIAGVRRSRHRAQGRTQGRHRADSQRCRPAGSCAPWSAAISPISIRRAAGPARASGF